MLFWSLLLIFFSITFRLFFVVHLHSTFSRPHDHRQFIDEKWERRWWRNHIKDFHRNENQCVGNCLMLCTIKCHLRFSVNYVITNYDFMLIFCLVVLMLKLMNAFFSLLSQQFLSSVRCSLIEIVWIFIALKNNGKESHLNQFNEITCKSLSERKKNPWKTQWTNKIMVYKC